jgi:hypothetical protein
MSDADGRPLKQDGQVGSLTWAALFGPDMVPVATEVASPLLAAVLSTAASQVGCSSNRRIRTAVPRWTPTCSAPACPSTSPATQKPWCCAFVYWCFDEAARAQGRANAMVRTGGCLDHWNRAGAQGTRRIAASKAVNDPSLVQPGMIFIMDHGERRGHTGLVEQVAGGMLHTIEGNTDASLTREGGGVYRLKRKIADINKGFIDYGSA